MFKLLSRELGLVGSIVEHGLVGAGDIPNHGRTFRCWDVLVAKFKRPFFLDLPGEPSCIYLHS